MKKLSTLILMTALLAACSTSDTKEATVASTTLNDAETTLTQAKASIDRVDSYDLPIGAFNQAYANAMQSLADKAYDTKMTIELIKADYNPKLLQCFASQQGAVETTVETHSTANGEVLTLTTQAPEKFKIKRARYNCTVPSSQKGRYYWYSQPWQMY